MCNATQLCEEENHLTRRREDTLRLQTAYLERRQTEFKGKIRSHDGRKIETERFHHKTHQVLVCSLWIQIGQFPAVILPVFCHAILVRSQWSKIERESELVANTQAGRKICDNSTPSGRELVMGKAQMPYPFKLKFRLSGSFPVSFASRPAIRPAKQTAETAMEHQQEEPFAQSKYKPLSLTTYHHEMWNFRFFVSAVFCHLWNVYWKMPLLRTWIQSMALMLTLSQSSHYSFMQKRTVRSMTEFFFT